MPLKPFPLTETESAHEFERAARELGMRADVKLEVHPLLKPDGEIYRGPDGKKLATRIAFIGNPEAETVYIKRRGTHGPEGRMGSALQIDLMENLAAMPEQERVDLLKKVRIVLFHGGAYGAAYDTRGNEVGQDENRGNYRRWDRLPKLAKWLRRYPGLMRKVLCPTDLSDENVSRTRRIIDRIITRETRRWIKKLPKEIRETPQQIAELTIKGERRFWAAIMRGQGDEPGLLWTGRKPSQTTILWRNTMGELLKNVKMAILADDHSGAGFKPGIPQGLLLAPKGSPVHQRTLEIFQDGPKARGEVPIEIHCLGASVDAKAASGTVSGTVAGDLVYCLPMSKTKELRSGKGEPQVMLISMGIEYAPRAQEGKPDTVIDFGKQVMEYKRLREAAFLGGYTSPNTGRFIAGQRDSFTPADPVWQETVVRHSRLIDKYALAALKAA